MKETAKHIFKKAGIYHPLQSFYRKVIHKATSTLYAIRFRKYQGRGFICNVCGRSYEKFADWQPSPKNAPALNRHKVIAGYGKNIICPGCMSTARERLVIAMLQGMEIAGRKIIHFSPEKHVFDYLKSRADVITADLEPGFYKSIDKHVTAADVTKLPFADRTFDVLIANHIMEHIPDDKQAMRELYRILKPGAIAIMQVPFSESLEATLETPDVTDPAICSALYGQRDHVRIYNLNDYASRLTSVGFAVEVIPYSLLKDLYQYAIQEDESFIGIMKPIS
jgi:SAM-dependent methyltransferase